MKCPKCGVEYSERVMVLHVPECKNEPSDVKTIDGGIVEPNEKETRLKAKELGIKNWHIKKIEKLESEIAEKEGD